MNNRFLTNIYDPSAKNAKDVFTYPSNMDRDTVWEIHIDWINSHVLGQPQETEFYTVEQLREAGFLGLYAKE